ncbi:hypothetical protein [Cohnella nanjingensis]|uniref:Uncharacterized protein n=1 Tax=Cohnella nanjingensis TaxID=1387779 RepID=A0A7X0RPJ6_9BACL|nr:hypothetical protein [Cohnella nanjingensis]MBB6671352.1 hypothetical protein [Cohnella nanjingensis]
MQLAGGRFFTPDDSANETSRMPNAAFRPIESVWAHFAGRGIHAADTACIDEAPKRLLATPGAE